MPLFLLQLSPLLVTLTAVATRVSKEFPRRSIQCQAIEAFPYSIVQASLSLGHLSVQNPFCDTTII